MSMFHELMMRKKGGGVEFKTSIYATGNAYIQTDISANADYKIRVKGRVLANSISSNIYFLLLSGLVKHQNVSRYQGFLSYFVCRNGVSTVELGSFDSWEELLNPTFDYVDTFSVGSNRVEHRNFDLSISNTFSVNSDISILGKQNIGYSNDNVGIELIEIKDQSDNLLHELKPAIVNGESGMYDTVTETFYGNANSVGSLVCE